MNKKPPIIIAIYLILASLPAFSQPSEGIRTLIQTPASAFDVFLNQIYIKLNGPTHFGTSHLAENLHVFQLEYNAKENLIHIGLHIGPDHNLMSGFSSSDANGKKDILVKAAKSIAKSLGLTAEGNPFPIRYGLIQITKIRNGWGDMSLDEDRIKEEIADRTALKVVYAWEKKNVYVVERSSEGRYEYSIMAK